MQVKKVEFVIQGRKVQLEEIRRKTLIQHAPYMRDHPNDYYNNMSSQSIIARLKEVHESDQSEQLSAEQLKDKLKCPERHKHLLIWHDN